MCGQAAYMGARSVRLGFAWKKHATAKDEDTRIRFLQRVAQRHPELRRVCQDASVRRA